MTTAIEQFTESVSKAHPNEGPWEKYKISPKNRTVYPTAIYLEEGLIENAEYLVGNDDSNTTYLKSDDASITLDFGFNTCGIYKIEFAEDSTPGQTLHISFSESNQFVDKNNSDRSMDFFCEDTTLEIPVKTGTYTSSPDKQRGAFKYMTISTRKSTGQIAIKRVSTTMTCMPSLGERLDNYSGFFYSDDDFANTIWYAGAYTVQLATIPTRAGRTQDFVMPKTGWSNSMLCGCGEEVLTDGARRDRSVWSGDRFITQASESIAFNSKASINGTDWMLKYQDDNGEFPYACPPIYSYGSDTYNLWTIMSIYDSYFRLGLKGSKWIKELWPQWLKSMEYLYAKVDKTGLMNCDRPLDWGRPVLKGHPLSLNCMLYKTLKLTEEVALDEFDDPKIAEKYSQRAELLKSLINKTLWDEKAGMYTDFIDSDVHSQDGNVLVITFDVAPKERFELVSKGLTGHWNEYGAVAVESGGMISPFQSSIELFAHTLAGHSERSFELFKTMWGYMWNAPYSVKSSLIEGYFKDGSCKYPFILYDPAYISHCHPWASGPTTFFTYYVLGLQITKADHSEWVFEPKGIFARNLFKFAQSGFTSNVIGFLSAGYKIHADNLLQLSVKLPKSLTGKIVIPQKESYTIESVELNGSKITYEDKIIVEGDQTYTVLVTYKLI